MQNTLFAHKLHEHEGTAHESQTDALRAENTRLRAALAPFAEAANDADATQAFDGARLFIRLDDGRMVRLETSAGYLRVSDLRNADETLKQVR